MIHDGDAVRELFRLVHEVGGEQDGTAPRPERSADVPELPARLGIQPGGGFVQKKHLRSTRE